MKFSLIVAVVVLALAQGSFAEELPTLESISRYFEEIRNKMTQELTEIIQKQDLANHAQNIQTQLEPLAAKFQEQLKTVATNVEEQIQPMIQDFQGQIQPLLRRLVEQAKPVTN
ncbi:Type-4 ice-structuring protein LS-12 [Collichthys lucidus]|uniref:Type-4 ice-structuring protein LS-12 n=1 Tax=Collichthys lucidus TaxID=240159 RepID=A0A4U5VJB5_COLLU|nr:Type-4 ice-structuring protein LS-12 [Collichthys lucidus]